MLQHFLMVDCKPLSVPIYMEIKILVEKCRITFVKMEDMDYIPYNIEVDSLLCAMDYIK